jgi:hypothetical protein
MPLKRPRNIYHCLKQRCTNPKNKDYKYYGGRGIAYDPKWVDFASFWKDMEYGYADDLTIDRINTDGNYYKENCHWIPRNQQQKNRVYRFSDYKWHIRIKDPFTFIKNQQKREKRTLEIEEKREQQIKKTIQRKEEIIQLRASGITLQKIGAKYNLTRERVRQILL